MTSLVLNFAIWSLAGFGFVFLLLQIAAREIGYWFGRRSASRSEAAPEGVGVVVGSMLALLAFVLALTLSFANNRFSEREAGALAEANAIGTAWLQAGAIGHPRGDEIARLMKDYAAVRSAFVKASYDRPVIDELSSRTSVLQNEMWGHVAAIVRERPDAVSSTLMASLNQAFDMSTAEAFAFEKRLPPPLFWLLIGMALLSMAALGFQLGLRGTPLRVMSALLTLMWTLVIIDILDLAAARIGDIRTSTLVYDWTLKGLEGGFVIPPPPAPR
jgi:hypothetical protein